VARHDIDMKQADGFPHFSKKAKLDQDPRKFKLDNINKYDKNKDPNQWMCCYLLQSTLLEG
jgi:hypothetical protein